MKIIAIVLRPEEEHALCEIVHSTGADVRIVRGIDEAKRTLQHMADRKFTNGRISEELLKKIGACDGC